jgi:hypothetical protein
MDGRLGLAFKRYYASAILIGLIVVLILTLPQKAGVHPGERAQSARVRSNGVSAFQRSSRCHRRVRRQGQAAARSLARR